MELLTTDGWSPANTVESIILQVRAMLIQGRAVVDNHATKSLGLAWLPAKASSHLVEVAECMTMFFFQLVRRSC